MTVWLDTLREMDRLRREIDRAFEGAGFHGWDSPFSRYSFTPARGARVYPLMNVREDGDNIEVEALAPGLNTDTLDVSVTGNQLRIVGEKVGLSGDIKPEAFHRSERGAGRFVRTIELPNEVDADKVKAEYRDGILHLTLPKPESAKPKQISVNFG